jgi:hypothetical protein
VVIGAEPALDRQEFVKALEDWMENMWTKWCTMITFADERCRDLRYCWLLYLQLYCMMLATMVLER